jgi:TolB-like protein/Flp pilus assembly protein TadD
MLPVPAEPASRSVAVLPFLSLSSDPENEFFADGITEDLIAQLSKLRSLKVISRTSAMQFKKRDQSLRDIAAKLGVATLVEGSVRRSGSRVRIVAELIDAETDAHLWVETYDRQLTDIFEIQSDVALRIAEGLKAELSPVEGVRIGSPAVVGVEAYQLLLRGRRSAMKYTEAGLREALEYFERALALEPSYAAAYEQTAFAFMLLALGFGSGAIRPREAHSRARAAVLRCLDLDPACGEAHGTLARKSVAVLPFLSLSSDPENEFFADGVTEDVIAQLSKLRGVKVISRTSAMQFKKREQSLKDIAAKLGVATLVEGSVRRAGSRVRIVAELVDAESDAHLWVETYDRQLTDIFEIQSEVALRIAEGLKAELSPSELARIAGRAPVGVEAYQLYLRGRQCVHRYTESGLREGLGHLERAVAVEPGYAAAHAQIALAYLILALGFGSGAIRPREAHARGRLAALRALEIDPEFGEAHGTTGALQFMFEFDWAGAEQSFRRALGLTPGNASVLDLFGLMLTAQQRYEEALTAQRRSRELDPLTLVHTSDVATTLIRAGRYDEAIQEARYLVATEPAFPLGHSTLGWACLLRGGAAEGLAELERAASLSPGNTLFLAQLGEAYAMAGQEAKARGVLAELDRLAQERYVMPYHLAYVHTGLGEHDRAIDLLEAAVEERSGGVYGIKGSFLFTPLRGHPGFRALLRRMNLADSM